jgi:hypothetical protein
MKARNDVESTSFAWRSSAFSFCSRLISAAASVITPGVDLVTAPPAQQRLRTSGKAQDDSDDARI